MADKELVILSDDGPRANSHFGVHITPKAKGGGTWMPDQMQVAVLIDLRRELKAANALHRDLLHLHRGLFQVLRRMDRRDRTALRIAREQRATTHRLLQQLVEK